MLDVQRGNAVAGGAGAIHRFLDRALGRAPADEQDIAFGRAINFRRRQRGAERLQFLATLGHHLHVQFRRAGWVAEFVVLQTGDDGIFAAPNARARRQVLRDAVGRGQIVGLVIGDRV